MSTLDKIAPYPTALAEVTADKMTAHLAAFALMHQTIALDHTFDTDRDMFTRSVGFVVAYYGLARLLRELQEHTGAKTADLVARDLWLAWEDGSTLGEWCWEWLTEYGIDPEAVQKVAAEVHAAEAAQAQKGGGDA